MLFGTNSLAWAQASRDLPGGLTSYRCYFTPGQNIPSAWPVTPAGATAIVSIKPNVTDLLAGKLKSQLAQFTAGAPFGSMLTAYHECNREMPAGQITAVHEYLAANMPAGVSFGAIYDTYKPQHGQDLKPFVVKGLDWYSLDGYSVDSVKETPSNIFGAAWSAVESVAGPSAKIGVTETNSRFNPALWIPAAWSWSAIRGAFCFAPFFNAPSGIPYLYPSGMGAVLAPLAEDAARS